MPFQIIRENIVNIKADAIVNSANPKVIIGEGVDKAIHDAAGPNLFIERQRIGEINTGEAYISSAFHLNSKYVIHTVGPDWIDGEHNEIELLSTCYKNALQLAIDHQCSSIAFPLISTGVNEFPKDKALFVALRTIKHFQRDHDIMVYLVIFDKESFVLPKKYSTPINNAIDLHSMSSDYDKTSGVQDGVFEHTFSEIVLNIINQNKFSMREVSVRASINQDNLSRIIAKKEKPRKSEAIAIAIALQLSLSETKDFIERAGYTLSNSNQFDVIVEYCIQRRYSIYIINMILFKYDQVLLGSVA